MRVIPFGLSSGMDIEVEIGFTTIQLAWIGLAYLLAAFVKGVTGLGFSTTCLPILVIAVGLKEALPLLIIPSIGSNLIVMRKAGRFGETVRAFWPMLVATLPGIVFGLWLLTRIDGALAAGILGVVLVLWCAFALRNTGFQLSTKWHRPLAPLSGFLTGTVNGLTGSQVMLSMPYLMSLGLQRAIFVQAMNCSFTLSSMLMAVGLSQLGWYTLASVAVSVVGTGIVFLGVTLGERIGRTLSTETFRLAVIAILAVMGVTLIARAVQ